MVLIGLLLATSVAAADPMRFDLVCTGIEPIFAGGGRWEKRPFSARLRVDLARQRFCEDDCKYVRPIKGATSKELVLLDEIAGVTGRPSPWDGSPATTPHRFTPCIPVRT